MKRIKLTICAAAMAALNVTPLSFMGQSAAAHDGHSPHPVHAPDDAPDDMKRVPSETVTPFCGGKYEEVAKELNRNNLLGNVNFYRMTSGLSKLKPERFGATRTQYGYYTQAETRRSDALMLLDKGQNHLSSNAQTDYLQALNMVMQAGSAADTALRFEDFNDGKNRFDCDRTGIRNLSPWQRMKSTGFCNLHENAVNHTRSNTAFDWLVTGNQMYGASNLWQFSGVKHGDKTNAALDHIDAQALKRPGVNIWMAQYGHHKVLERAVPPEILERARLAIPDILNCQATPSDYGIIAKGDLGLPREYLPKSLAELRTARDIHDLTYVAMTEGSGLDASYHAALQALADQLGHKGWVNGLLLLSAPDYDTAVALGEVAEETYVPYWGFSSRHKNILFALPAQYMPDRYPAMKMGHALSENEFELGLAAVPLALENKRSAVQKKINRDRISLVSYEGDERYQQYTQRLKTRIAQLSDEYEKYETLYLEASGLPDKVKLTLYAIFTEGSHNINTHHRGVYPVQKDERFLNYYLRRLLFPKTAFYESRYGPSYYTAPQSYFDPKQKPHHPAFQMNSLRKNDGTPEIGYAALVDWDKLTRIGGQESLLRTLALNTFDWLDSASAEDRARHADIFAPALYKLIRDGRHEITEDYQGAPIQKHAFERLHKYYGKTDSAKATPYWWPFRRAHGNPEL